MKKLIIILLVALSFSALSQPLTFKNDTATIVINPSTYASLSTGFNWHNVIIEVNVIPNIEDNYDGIKIVCMGNIDILLSLGLTMQQIDAIKNNIVTKFEELK